MATTGQYQNGTVRNLLSIIYATVMTSKFCSRHLFSSPVRNFKLKTISLAVKFKYTFMAAFFAVCSYKPDVTWKFRKRLMVLSNEMLHFLQRLVIQIAQTNVLILLKFCIIVHNYLCFTNYYCTKEHKFKFYFLSRSNLLCLHISYIKTTSRRVMEFILFDTIFSICTLVLV